MPFMLRFIYAIDYCEYFVDPHLCCISLIGRASYSRSSSALPEEHAEHAAGHVHDMAILRIVAVRSSSSEVMLHRGLEGLQEKDWIDDWKHQRECMTIKGSTFLAKTQKDVKTPWLVPHMTTKSLNILQMQCCASTKMMSMPNILMSKIMQKVSSMMRKKTPRRISCRRRQA